MKTRTAITAIVFLAVTLFAQGDATTAAASPAPAQQTFRMFVAAQLDSVLALVPGIDTLRSGMNIVGAGLDTLDNAVVVIALDKNGNPLKFVFPDSTLVTQPPVPAAAAVQAARPQAKPERDQRGRTWFIIETALKSAYVYPASYHRAFTHADDGVIGGISLLTVGGALYGTFAFTKNLELGYGKVGVMNYGSTFLGIHYPQLLSSLLHNATDMNKPYKDSAGKYEGPTATDRIKAWCSMIGFPLGIYAGSRWNIVDRNDGGAITLMGFFSQPTAYLLGYGLPFYFFNPASDRRDYLAASAFLTMGLMPAGFWAGHALAGDRQVSTGRASLPYVSGFLGGWSGLFIPTLFDLDMDALGTARLLATTTLIGYGGGTVLGLLYHPSNDYTYWQTVFTGASSGAGFLMGIAFPLIGGVKDNHKPYVAAGILGAWTGFFVGERLSTSLFEVSGRDRSASGLRMSLPGLAALPAIFLSDNDRGRRASPPLPVAELEWRF